VRQVFLAWLTLHRIGLPWRTGEQVSLLISPDELGKMMNHYRKKEVCKILSSVRERNGPFIKWEVDLKNMVATLGPFTLRFFLLENGEFLPSTYHRSDIEPDFYRDKPFIEDGIYCIEQALIGKTS
jgi:hypothetical protein